MHKSNSFDAPSDEDEDHCDILPHTGDDRDRNRLQVADVAATISNNRGIGSDISQRRMAPQSRAHSTGCLLCREHRSCPHCTNVVPTGTRIRAADNTQEIHSNRRFIIPNHISLSVIVCLGVYLVITLSSDIAVFYQPSGSAQRISLQNAAAFGVEHGREIPFPLAERQAVPDVDKNLQFKNNQGSKQSIKESARDVQQKDQSIAHLNTRSTDGKKHVRRPSLANVRMAQSSFDSVPVFYPPEPMIADLHRAKNNNQEKHFAPDLISRITLTHDTSTTTISAVLGLLTAVSFSMMLIICGSNEVRKKWKGVQLRRMREQEIRSR